MSEEKDENDEIPALLLVPKSTSTSVKWSNYLGVTENRMCYLTGHAPTHLSQQKPNCSMSCLGLFSRFIVLQSLLIAS